MNKLKDILVRKFSKTDASLVEIYFMEVAKECVRGLIKDFLKQHKIINIGIFRDLGPSESEWDVVNDYVSNDKNLQGNISFSYNLKIQNNSLRVVIYIMRLENKPDMFDVDVVLDNNQQFHDILRERSSFDDFLNYFRNLGAFLMVLKFYINEESLDPRKSNSWVSVEVQKLK